MGWGLGRLADILREYDYKALDLLICMTLDVENYHATVHSKKLKWTCLSSNMLGRLVQQWRRASNVLQAGLRTITPVDGPGTQSTTQRCLFITYRWWCLCPLSAFLQMTPGGVLPYTGYIGMCRCEGYGFQAVYSRIGYINQSVWL